MPRAARLKEPSAIYHVMSRSITEFNMFPDNSDKEYFLDLLQKCKERFCSKVYGFCLMTNHYHLIIDTLGYDISKFMKSLNLSYVRYINKKYNRKGHLLTERFSSKIIDSDEYLLTVSAYIHNNSKDLPDKNDREFDYTYSSMGIYMKNRKDKRNLVDTDFILGCINESDKSKAVKAYIEMVKEKRDIGINRKLSKYLEEFKRDQYEYKPYREVILRDMNPVNIIKSAAKIFGVDDISVLDHRWKRSTMEFRQAVAYMLTVYCGLQITEVCKYMHSITASCCGKLADKGFKLVGKRNEILNMLVGV